MATINIRGDIVGDDDKWIYDWFDMAATCPKDVKEILNAAEENEPIEVLINSGGGSVMAGQEIYSVLKGNDRVTIKIQSLAGSAAGVVAMAGRSQISPVAMIMIHNVSMSGASGDYHDMQKNLKADEYSFSCSICRKIRKAYGQYHKAHGPGNLADGQSVLGIWLR